MYFTSAFLVTVASFLAFLDTGSTELTPNSTKGLSVRAGRAEGPKLTKAVWNERLGTWKTHWAEEERLRGQLAQARQSMVLVIGVGRLEPPPDTRSLFMAYPVYRDSAARFVTINTKVVGPMGLLLYVQEREMAATVPQDANVNIIGSDDATTSIIAILRHTGSGATGLAHFDGAGTEEGVLNLVHRVQELAMSGNPGGRYELSLIGGFSDSDSLSEELFYNLMHAFHKQPVEIDLVLACIGELNTVVKNGANRPVLYGAGVNVKTGEIFPAVFPDKGPEQALRNARKFTGGQQVIDIYDYSLGLLKIGPFNYDRLGEKDLWMMNQPDEVILKQLSSTPEVEPPHFPMQMKATLKFIHDNPLPAVTVFRDNQPHYYRRDKITGAWIPSGLAGPWPLTLGYPYYGYYGAALLVIGGMGRLEPPPDTRTLFLTYPVYRDLAAQFLSINTKVVGPMGLLYVQQREMAATVPQDMNVNIIGSDEATTCIIAILRHTGSGAVGLAHFDGAGTEEGVFNLVHIVQELAMSGYTEGRYELFLIGGFSDSNGLSEEIFYNLMHAFKKQTVEIDLVLACIGELNTVVKNGVHRPVLYGAGVNVKTGEIFPAVFPDKGPEQALRNARKITGGEQLLDIYDSSRGLLRIGPFNYNPLGGKELWLMNQPDGVILQQLSTTPDVEPPNFVMQIRATLKYIQDNPFPALTVFRDNQPHYYRRDATGAWSPFPY